MAHGPPNLPAWYDSAAVDDIEKYGALLVGAGLVAAYVVYGRGHYNRRTWVIKSSAIGYAYAAGIVIGTTIPWNTFQRQARWSGINWAPFSSGSLYPMDMLHNVLLFFPLGVFLEIGYSRNRLGLVYVLSFSALLACGLETVQLFNIARVPQIADPIMNIAGAAIGALSSLGLRRLMSGLR
ncbi:VanZ family protein [Nitrospira sp. Nam74]